MVKSWLIALFTAPDAEKLEYTWRTRVEEQSDRLPHPRSHIMTTQLEDISTLEIQPIVVRLQPVINLTDDQFYEFCQLNI